MKITVVCDILGKEDNGTTIATMNFIRHLQKNNEVRILCCDQTKVGQPGYFVTKTKKFPGYLGKFVKATGFALAKVDEDIVRQAVEGADIIHCLEPFALSMAAIKYAKKHNIPVTAAVHLLPEHILYYIHMSWNFVLNWAIYKYWWNHTYKHVDAIHFPTEFDRNLFTNYNRLTSKKKTYIISNGVREDVVVKQIAKPEEYKDKYVIVCVGRYSPEKAQCHLIKAMKYSKHANKIQLIFAGQGQRQAKYEKLSKSLAIPPVFKRFTHSEIVDVFNYADIVAHPAILETEGISVLEAMRLGKLVIVSDAKKAAPRTFGLEHECIFKAKKPAALAKTIDFWLDHPELIKKYGDKNLERTKHLNISECLEKTEQMLKDVYEWHKRKNNG